MLAIKVSEIEESHTRNPKSRTIKKNESNPLSE